MKKHTFDTLEQAENLQKSGFTNEQANGMTRVIADALSACHDDLMKEIAACHDDLFGKITDTRDELMSKLATKHEMQLGFAKLDRKILTMTISLGVAMITSIGALGTILTWIK